MRLLSFLSSLHFRRNRADLDLLKIRREGVVKTEGVPWVHISSWWMLLQYLVLGASQRLKISREFATGDVGSGSDFLCEGTKVLITWVFQIGGVGLTS